MERQIEEKGKRLRDSTLLLIYPRFTFVPKT